MPNIHNAIEDVAAEIGQPIGKVALAAFGKYLRDKDLTGELVEVLRTTDSCADPDDMRASAEDILFLANKIASTLNAQADERESGDPYDRKCDAARDEGNAE